MTSRISLAGPLAGGLAAIVCICIGCLLYWWRKQQKRQQAHSLRPYPFDPTSAGINQFSKWGTIESELPQDFQDDIKTTSMCLPLTFLQIIEPLSNIAATHSVVPFSELLTSGLPSLTMVAVPSVQSEETERELRRLQRLVCGMRALESDYAHTRLHRQSVGTCVTPPPDYATGRGSSVEMIQDEED